MSDPASLIALESASTGPFLTNRYAQVNVSLRQADGRYRTLAPMTRPKTSRSITPTKQQRLAIGKRLAETIEKKGYTQVWLAEQLNCTEAQVSKMCKHGQGGLWAFAQACDALGESLDYIVLARFPTANQEFMEQLKTLMNSAEKSKK